MKKNNKSTNEEDQLDIDQEEIDKILESIDQ